MYSMMSHTHNCSISTTVQWELFSAALTLMDIPLEPPSRRFFNRTDVLLVLLLLVILAGSANKNKWKSIRDGKLITWHIKIVILEVDTYLLTPEDLISVHFLIT